MRTWGAGLKWNNCTDKTWGLPCICSSPFFLSLERLHLLHNRARLLQDACEIFWQSERQTYFHPGKYVIQ